MSTVVLKAIGRFGNLCFQHAYARAFCEQNGHELRTDPWIGEQIFTLDGHTPKRPDGTEQIALSGYFQNQDALIYTRADCRRWFAFRQEIFDKLNAVKVYNLPYAHFRRGDYASPSSGYPMVSKDAVTTAMGQHGIYDPCIPVSDEAPSKEPDYLGFDGELSMLPDFWRLVRAPIMFRANSSYSYWAGVLSHGRVFSPIITGLAGGVEHDDVPFVEGNWPRLAELEFVTDLHLKE